MKRGHDHEETPWASFADALAGMLFVFIITTVLFVLRAQEQEKAAQSQQAAAQIQQAAAQTELDRLTGAKKAARDLVEQLSIANQVSDGELTTCLKQTGRFDAVFPERSDARVSLYVPERGGGDATPVAWFADCDSTLDAQPRAAAEAIRGCIGVVTASATVKDYDLRVYLEGHTDATTVGKDCKARGFASNWELSAARAAAVLRVVADPSVADVVTSRLNDGTLQLLAVGMADTSPGWKRICADEAVASPLCTALGSSDDPRHDKVVESTLDDERCVTVGFGDGCVGSSFQARLCRWANDCNPDKAVNDARRKQLRRVDLRIELTVREGVP